MTYQSFADRLKAVDLHYHAGVERQNGLSLNEYIQHAWDTGRRCQGITDHIDLYLSDHPLPDRPRAYAVGLDGIFQLYQEFCLLRERFPGMRLFFAPEYHSEFFPDGRVRYPFGDFSPEIARLADYIICDVGLDSFAPLGIEAQTAAHVRTVREIGALAQRIGKPTYYAHPLRGVIERTISRYARPGDVERERIAQGERLCAAGGLPDEDVLDALFQVHFRTLGRASRQYGVPLEVNGMTQDRIRRNHPQLYPAYVQAYSIMAEEGATFVPGSDQHEIDSYPCIVPRNEPFITLGPSALDQSFLREIGIPLTCQN